MKAIHTPRINGRYWTAILLASVFGTNLGDFYAHTTHLGIVGGLLVLALLAAVVFTSESVIDAGSEMYYWLVIVIIRTGATNIADYCMYRLHVPGVLLITGLVALLALFSWATQLQRTATLAVEALPSTGTAYWLAMLSAGVFGTVAGDFSEEGMGERVAALVLTVFFCLCCSSRTGMRQNGWWCTGSRSQWRAPRERPSATGSQKARHCILVCLCVLC